MGGENTMHKVLLVDDDHFVRKGLFSLIDWQDCGFKVCGEANNGEDALEMIKQMKPDLIITDIRMPVLDGLELIKYTIESTTLHPNFVIISGHNDFKYAQQAMRYGVHDFILKPIDKDEFEKKLLKVAKKIKNEDIVRKNKKRMDALITFEELLQGKIDKKYTLRYRQKLHIDKAGKMRYIIVEMNNISYDVATIKDKINDEIYTVIQDDLILIREHGINSFGLLITDQQLKCFDN